MDTRLFALVYQEAQNYSSWQKKQRLLMQLAEEETERENVKALMKAKDFYSTMFRGAA
jgi:hypothetical protein